MKIESIEKNTKNQVTISDFELIIEVEGFFLFLIPFGENYN